MKKTLALVLIAVLAFTLCAACGSKNDAPAAAPAAEAPAAPAADVPAAPAAGDDFQEWLAYLAEYASAGAPSEEEGAAVKAAILACASEEDVDAISQMGVLFSSVGVLRYPDWVAAGKPAADTANMGSPSGEASSGEPSGEPAA